jgi:SAM-dependent methyltransferase
MSKLKKQAWSTKDAMDQVYKLKLWGSNSSEFYSGEGSHLPEIVDPYIEKVVSFLKSFENPLIVCDLGCGDFNIGKELFHLTEKYYAADIVEDLIEFNKEKFKVENLEFQCLNIAEDELPKGDCAIIRQVLQHLSNTEIQTIANKLSNYKYIIITEHLPIGYFEPNKDIISGQGIRIKKLSGVNLTAPPFNLKVKEEKEILSFELKNGKGRIVTKLYVL